MQGHLWYDCVTNCQQCEEVVDCAACFVALRKDIHFILKFIKDYIPDSAGIEFCITSADSQIDEDDFYFHRRAWP